jgi:hypothetical protein
LDMVPKNDVLDFFDSKSVEFKIRFKSNCSGIDSAGLEDVLGTLTATEPCSAEHQAAAGAIGQCLVLEMESIGHCREIRQLPSPHIMIGSCIKEPDMTLLPFASLIGNGVLDDGFGFPIPTLIVEVAFAESREQLLEDLNLWISPQSSAQVVIGIKIHGTKESSDYESPGTIQAIEAILYRRNVPNPEQTVRFHPAQPNTRPVLLVHLSDLMFGVPRGRLSEDLQERVERDETIEIDLDYIRQVILQVHRDRETGRDRGREREIEGERERERERQRESAGGGGGYRQQRT